KSPFFLVHGNYAYARLASYLDQDQPFYGLAQYLEQGTVRHRRIETMAAHYLQKLRMVQPNGPYFIGGHSAGAWLAFEIAQQLHNQGEEVALVALLDPTFLEDTVSFTARTSIRNKVRQHSLNLAVKSPREKLNYVLWWLRSHLQTRIYNLVCKRLICE